MKALFAFILLFPAATHAINLTSGLLAHFNMDGNTQDVSGNGLHATLSGAHTVVADRLGNSGSAIRFEDDAIRTAAGLQATGTGINLAGSSMTLSLWYSKERDPFNDWILRIGSASATGQSAHVYLDYPMASPSDVGFSFFYDDFGTTSSPEQQVNTWYHLAVTFDASTNERMIFIDGQQVASGIAARGFTGDSFFGFGKSGVTLDDYRIYNRVLDTSEISALAAVPESSSPFVAVGTAFLVFAGCCVAAPRKAH